MKYSSIIKNILGSLVLWASITSLNAQTIVPVELTTTALPLLRISPDARAGGMADMGIATSPDANSMYHNQAKTVFNGDTAAISATYIPWLRDLVSDMYIAGISGYYKIDGNQAVTGSLRYFNMGEVPIKDHNGKLMQNANSHEMAIDLGYSRRLSERFSVGLSFRYINSKVIGGLYGDTYKAANVVGADIAGYYNGLNNDGDGITVGLILSNLGSKVSYSSADNNKYFQPANMGIGVAYTKVIDEHKLTLSAEANKLLVPKVKTDSAGIADYFQTGVVSSWFKSFGNDAYRVSGGVEYAYDNMFFGRVGYSFGGKEESINKFFTAGIGVQYQAFGVDFSYLIPANTDNVNRSPLANTIRLSLQYIIGKKK